MTERNTMIAVYIEHFRPQEILIVKPYIRTALIMM